VAGGKRTAVRTEANSPVAVIGARAVLDVEERLPERYDRRIATCGLMIATAMQAADALIANVALPRLEADLGGGAELGAWIITTYLCATAVVAPLTGWLRRRYGATRLFSAAMALFITASLLCSLSPSGPAIIAARILQGAGGGVIHPLCQAILLDIHPKARHGRMLAMWGAALMVGPIFGPVIGGVIADLASWRWVFVINLPFGLVAVWCLRHIRSRMQTTRDLSIDPFGIVFLMVGVGALQLCLGRGVGQGWFASSEITAEAVIAIAALALLVLRARYSNVAVVKVVVFSDINFSTATFFNFMLSAILFVAVLFVPLMGEGPLGYSATLAGALIMPRAILMTMMMLVVGRLIERIDLRILLATGWVLMAAGLAILSQTSLERSIPWIIIGSTIQAIGAGMLYAPLSTLAFYSLPPELRTDGTGLFSLLRQVGYASGVALMTAVLRMRTADNLAGIASHDAQRASARIVDLATLHAYGDCFRFMAFVALFVVPGVFLFRIGQMRGTAEKQHG
jgi:MFS transporter, DHA2 family, multidrug resistance protein